MSFRLPRLPAARVIALTYLALLLAAPVGMVAYRTFGDGLGPVIDSLSAWANRWLPADTSA